VPLEGFWWALGAFRQVFQAVFCRLNIIMDQRHFTGSKNNDGDLWLVEDGNNFIGSCSISIMLVDDLPSKDGLFLFV